MSTGFSRFGHYQLDAATRKRSLYHTCETCNQLLPQHVGQEDIISHRLIQSSCNPS
ncbi:hypothetical protein ABVT39_023463, partial [Epinephelus coioides]